jgi:hypothetical protein
MGRLPAPTLSSRQGRLTAYRLIRELRDRLCDAVDSTKLSVMVGTFFLVRGGFLGRGRACSGTSTRGLGCCRDGMRVRQFRSMTVRHCVSGTTPPSTKAASPSASELTVGCSANPMGNPVSPGLVMRIWHGTSTSPAAEQSSKLRSVINSLRWTASTIPTPQRSVPAGEANPSTCTPASKPSSPSNFPGRTTTKINKPPSARRQR